MAFVVCLAQHAKDHKQENEHEPDYDPDYDAKQVYWVCAYANNQWKLDEELVDDLTQTSFRKALDKAEGTVTVLDSGSVTFTRVWCCYEIYVSLALTSHNLCVPGRIAPSQHIAPCDPRNTRSHRFPTHIPSGSTRSTLRSSTGGNTMVPQSTSTTRMRRTARQWA